jgi:hypothetical protein
MSVQKTTRWILQGVLVYVLFVLTISLAIYAINLKQRFKAAGLLRDVTTLRVGQSTEAEVQRIISRYGGGPSQSSGVCGRVEAAYNVWTGNQTVGRVARAVPVLSRVGLHQWGVAATILVQGQAVCYVSYNFGMQDSNGGLPSSVESILLPTGKIYEPVAEHPGYKVGIRDLWDGHRLRSEVTPEASEEQRRRALSYDLSCVTRIRGCQQRCEIAPLVWRDAYWELQKASLSLPIEETSNPRCRFAQKTP